ncbi:MAG: hypothetical protein FWG66_11055 [Spirochaetes bacterium]|nr:hypothetical protein [Spirochaetota bacterium]
MRGLDRYEDQLVCLQMEISKGNFQTEADGNFYFDVEASNENLDLHGQTVLQRALLESKEYFLTNGVISKDHLHKRTENGRTVNDEEYVIGEPLSVYVDGKSTRVTGKLYAKNRHAKKFIELLESGSSRVKASVAGIMPRIVKAKDGTEKVLSFLWNDLAFTIAPVNHTVSPACGILAKSLTGSEFVKTLSAGGGTDSSLFEGGRALQREDLGAAKGGHEAALAGLVSEMSEGRVNSLEEARSYLEGRGINGSISLDVVRELIKNRDEIGEALPMAKQKEGVFEAVLGKLQKALSSGGDGGGIAKSRPDDDDWDDDDEDDYEDDDDDEGDGAEKIAATVRKALEENAEATGLVMKALAGQIESLQKSQEEIAKALREMSEAQKRDGEFKKSVGEDLAALKENAEKIAASPAPRRGAASLSEAGLQKGGFGDGGQMRLSRPLTFKDRDDLFDIVIKAVDNKEMDAFEAGKLETQINKSVNHPNSPIGPELLAFLKKKLPDGIA